MVHLPRMEGWGDKPYVKNGPSLGGHGAVAMNSALTASMTKLPKQLRKTLTWDRGKELSGDALFALETGTRVFFADPHSPRQRPSSENTNGILRQYFPKGTDLTMVGRVPRRPSLTRSTIGPARSLAGGHQLRSSRSNYAPYNNPVLHRPVEPAQFRSRKFVSELNRQGLVEPMGRVGAAGVNAAMESFFAPLQRYVLDRHR